MSQASAKDPRSPRQEPGDSAAKDEETPFSELVTGVKRLRSSRIAGAPVESTRVIARRHQAARWSIEDAADRVRRRVSGFSATLMDDLVAGRFPPAREIDLHRLSAEAARGVLRRSVAQARQDDVVTLLVICGRGLHSGAAGPVLRDVVVEELSEKLDGVLAFCTAPVRLGGAGALLVRMRRARASSRRQGRKS